MSCKSMCWCVCLSVFVLILTSPLQTLPVPSGAGSTCHRGAYYSPLAHFHFRQTLLLLEQCMSGNGKTADRWFGGMCY